MKVTAHVPSSPVEQVRPQTPVRTQEAAPRVRDDNSAHAYYNQAVKGIDGLRNVRVRPGVLENLLADVRVDKATQKGIRDNDTARDVKDGYKALYDSAREQQRAAQGLADNLGPGQHKLLDGSVVSVTQNKDGSTTVTTTRPDGSKTVAELSADPSQFRFTSTDASGLHSTTTQRDGSSVSQSSGFLQGGVDYRLDDNGNPVRTTRGMLGATVTRVNGDGSTDSWQPQGPFMIPGPITHEPPRFGSFKPR